MIEIRAIANWGDVTPLASNLRKEEAAEAWAAMHWMPAEALRCSIEASAEPYMVVDGDEILGAFGIGVTSPLEGAPWLLTAEGLPGRARLRFLRASRDYIEYALHQWPILVNYVDARDTVAVRWIEKWLKFVVEAPEPFGLDQLPFHRFSREN